MTKVQKTSQNITPFAGVFFALKCLDIRMRIDNHLVIYNSDKGYFYGNLFWNKTEYTSIVPVWTQALLRKKS